MRKYPVFSVTQKQLPAKLATERSLDLRQAMGQATGRGERQARRTQVQGQLD